MAKRRGWGWSNKHGFLMLEVNGVATRIYGNYGDEKLNSSTDTIGVPLGTPLQLPDGRVYRYALSGTDTLIGAGMLCQDPLKVAADDMDLVVVTGTLAASTITLTTAGAITEDLYKDGYIYVNDAAGEGHIYRIKSHPAEATGAGSLVITLADGETVKEALTTSSRVGLKKNPYNGVLLYNTTEDGIPRGVATTEVTTLYYCWLQTWGDAAVLINSTVVVGKAVAPGTTTTGSVDTYPITMTFVASGSPDTYTDGDKAIIGWVADPIAVTTQYGHIFLTIAP